MNCNPVNSISLLAAVFMTVNMDIFIDFHLGYFVVEKTHAGVQKKVRFTYEGTSIYFKIKDFSQSELLDLILVVLFQKPNKS